MTPCDYVVGGCPNEGTVWEGIHRLCTVHAHVDTDDRNAPCSTRAATTPRKE